MTKKILLKKEEKKMFDFLYLHASSIQQCLRLTHYIIHFNDEKCKVKNAAMTISVDHQYLEADISIKDNIKEHWKLKDHQVIINCLTHEICHILIDKLYFCYEDVVEKHTKKGDKPKTKKGKFYRERLTEHVSRWGVRLYMDFMKVNGINLKTGKCISKQKKK